MADDSDRPADLETKINPAGRPTALLPEFEYERPDTRDTVIGHGPAPVPHLDRVGSQLEPHERKLGDQVTGSPAQGNGLDNTALKSVNTLTTDPDGTMGTTATTEKGRKGPKS